jgi:hypothetical protein
MSGWFTVIVAGATGSISLNAINVIFPPRHSAYGALGLSKVKADG